MFIHLKNYNKRHDRWIYSDDTRMTNCGTNKTPAEVKDESQESEHTFIHPPPGLIASQNEMDFSRLMELAALCPPPRAFRAGIEMIFPRIPKVLPSSFRHILHLTFAFVSIHAV
jgi:hypothetical protein